MDKFERFRTMILANFKEITQACNTLLKKNTAKFHNQNKLVILNDEGGGSKMKETGRRSHSFK